MTSAAPRALLVYDYLARYSAGLAEGLRANGWEPALLNREHDHAFGGVPGAMNRYLVDRLGPDLVNPRLRGRVRDLRRLDSMFEARGVIRSLAPDVTHVQLCVANDVRLLAAARLRRGRYAATVHDVDVHPGDRPQSRARRILMREITRNAGLVFVHAEPLRDELLARGLARGPVVVVPHGIDAGPVAPLPASPSLLFFGRISEYKGLRVLLDAMPALWRQQPAVELTIAGEGTLPDHPVLSDPRVRLLHRHIDDAEVAQLFAAASLVVLPYVEASQSGVGSQAKGFGRPLVASAVGGLGELVADGSGELVAPGDPEALAACLGRLVVDRVALEAMAARGLGTLRDHAGWPAVGRATIEAYERHLPAGRARRTSSPRRAPA